MKVIDVLQKPLIDACPMIHSVRMTALVTAVQAGVNQQKVSVTGLGRSLKSLSDTNTKHDIKRMDRLVGNSHLHAERVALYAVMARWLVGGTHHPLILVDWSPVEGQEIFQLLRASIPMGGRALPIYEETYPESKLGHADAHEHFLKTLKALLPAGCQPIIITDAGFKAPWFRLVESLNWFWLSRVRGHVHIDRGDDTWLSCKDLFKQATNKAIGLGELRFSQSSKHACQGYLYNEPKKGRQKTKKRGGRSQCTTSKYQETKANEPWLLVAKLPSTVKSAHHVVQLYKTRMQIEEGFRDTKNQRLGVGLSQARSTTTERYDNLLLIAALVLFVLWCIGKVAVDRGYHSALQANTVRSHAVLSYCFIAIQIVDDSRYVIYTKDLLSLINKINLYVKTLHNVQ